MRTELEKVLQNEALKSFELKREMQNKEDANSLEFSNSRLTLLAQLFERFPGKMFSESERVSQ